MALTRGWLAADALAEGRLVRPFGAARIALTGEWWIADGPRATTAGPSARVRDWLLTQGAGAG